MAYRVEIGEIVENATGLNVTGALVTVKYHGGANAPVYDAENGGALLAQPLATVNGKIGADAPSGAWVAEGDYDLVIAGGASAGGDLTFFWPARRGTQFVTSLPAGAGTSAPEDGERVIELYDATNGGAWMRRYRAAASAWDMVGGPPPAGSSLPGTPRTRQEFYVTGASPAVQHLRYNGASWDYVGTPPMVPVTGSPLSVLDTGQLNHRRAGRDLALVDFSTLCALPTTPVLLANLSSLTTNSGTGGALTNKGTVLNGIGVAGQGSTSASFTGSTAQALYIADTGASDPFRLKTGSVGCWFRAAKRGTLQMLVTKEGTAAANLGWALRINTSNAVEGTISVDGTAQVLVTGGSGGSSDVCDDRWHYAVMVWDGTLARVYVDMALEGQAAVGAITSAVAKPLNIGGRNADAGTAADQPHFGRIDEVFVTTDVLSEDQVRLLYAAAIPHGYATAPARASLTVRRRRRGAALVSGDFPSQPRRLHNFTAGALTDAGADNQTLTNTGTAVANTGADGTKDGAFQFNGSTQNLTSAVATGLPAALTSRTGGAWFKTTYTAGAADILTTGSTDFRYLYISSGGLLGTFDGTTALLAGFVADGQWHFVASVYDNAATDAKRKLYLDGRLVASDNNFATTTVTGLFIGRQGAAATEFFPGTIDTVFVSDVALTADQVYVLYQKSSQALPTSIKEEGAHIEAIDATNVYFVGDQLESQNQIDLSVAS